MRYLDMTEASRLLHKNAVIRFTQSYLIPIMAFLFGYSLISSVMPPVYWRGVDGWLYKPVVETIISRGLDPSSLDRYYRGYVGLNVSGFFYLLTLFHLVTKMDVDTVLRIGAPMVAGLTCSTLYLLVRKYSGALPGLLTCILFFSNEIVLKRYSFLYRENFAILLMSLFFLLLFYYRDDPTSYLYNMSAGLLYGLIVISHPLVAVVTNYILLNMLIDYRKKIVVNKQLITAIFLAATIIFPFIGLYLNIAFFYLPKYIPHVSAFTLCGFILLYFKKYSIIKVNSVLIDRLLGAIGVALILFYLLYWNHINYGLIEPPIMLYIKTSILVVGVIGYLVSQFTDKNRFIKRMTFLFLLLINLQYAGIGIPIHRSILYMAFLAAAMCGSLSVDIKQYVSSLLARFNIPIRGLELGFFASLLLSGCLFSSVYTAYTSPIRYESMFEEMDVDSAVKILGVLEDGDVVVAEHPVYNLLIYAGVNIGQLYPTSMGLSELFTVQDPQLFSKQVKLVFPEAHRAIIVPQMVWRSFSSSLPCVKMVSESGALLTQGSLIACVLYIEPSSILPCSEGTGMCHVHDAG